MDFTVINKSIHIAKLKFSTKEDYFDFFINQAMATNHEEILESKNLLSAMHEHWHGEGKNGCIFALLAARERKDYGWNQLIITDDVKTIGSNKTLIYINKSIQKAIDDPKCEVLSLLFSKINTYIDLVKLIRSLLEIESIFLSNEEIIGSQVVLSLRTPINSMEVLAWLMAFGPFDSFPVTRQSPITEIAIRVKPKPAEQFYRLTKGDGDAHLADLPIPHREMVTERIWDNTYKRTRLILGKEPDVFSAAKTTFTLPKDVWKK